MSAIRLLPATVLLVCAGCTVRHPPPTLVEVAGPSPQQSWAQVLQTRVDDEGRVDFHGLREDPEPLERYVAWIAVVNTDTHPDVFADDETTLAFYINAYNALAMYNVLVSGTLPEDQLGFFVFQHFDVGGTYRSLYAFENDVIRRVGEPRVHFALNCVTRSCPRLPREPFEADRLDGQLEAAAREFINDDENVVVNDDQRTLYLSWIMRYYKKDFLQSARTLPAYINRYRDEPVPEDYRVWWLEYDWTLNSKGPRPPEPGRSH